MRGKAPDSKPEATRSKLPVEIGGALILVSIVQGLLELFEVGGFMLGYVADIRWLLMTGGLLMAVDQVYQLSIGALNPWLAVALAVALGAIVDPWYIGFFSALAVLKLLDAPAAVVKIIAPRKALARVLPEQH